MGESFSGVMTEREKDKRDSLITGIFQKLYKTTFKKQLS